MATAHADLSHDTRDKIARLRRLIARLERDLETPTVTRRDTGRATTYHALVDFDGMAETLARLEGAARLARQACMGWACTTLSIAAVEKEPQS